MRKDKLYPGEIGELWQVKYIPSYMQHWPEWKAKIMCWIMNRLPLKIVRKMDNWFEKK